MKYNNSNLLNSISSCSYVYKWVNKLKRGSEKCLKRP